MRSRPLRAPSASHTGRMNGASQYVVTDRPSTVPDTAAAPTAAAFWSWDQRPRP